MESHVCRLSPYAGPMRQLAGERSSVSDRASGPSVLVVEDEPGIVDFLRRGLEGEGFAVTVVLDGLEAEQVALSHSFDVIVLDVMLPGQGGLEVLRALRSTRPGLPVILLTARGEVEDRVSGLESGASDYVVKPFSLAELVARIRAQLRVAEQAAEKVLRVEDLEVDLFSRDVRRGGVAVQLSNTEFELLVLLLRNRGRVLTREQILSAVWGYEHDPATNVVDVYVGYLRRKLRQAGGPPPIHTVRSVGYRFGGG
jgi:DNA-binding response OmpR family regulator